MRKLLTLLLFVGLPTICSAQAETDNPPKAVSEDMPDMENMPDMMETEDMADEEPVPLRGIRRIIEEPFELTDQMKEDIGTRKGRRFKVQEHWEEVRSQAALLQPLIDRKLMPAPELYMARYKDLVPFMRDDIKDRAILAAMVNAGVMDETTALAELDKLGPMKVELEDGEEPMLDPMGDDFRNEISPLVVHNLGNEQVMVALKFLTITDVQQYIASERGLLWLAQQQLADGGWEYSDEIFEVQRPAATGLALLAFLSNGHTHVHGSYQEVVQRGFEYLQSISDEGDFRPEKVSLASNHFRNGHIYSHMIATLAFCELYGMTGDPSAREHAEAAIGRMPEFHSLDGGFKYIPRTPIGDLSVTGWAVMVLHSAMYSGLEIPDGLVENVWNFVLAHKQPNVPRFLYAKNTEPGKAKTAPSSIGVYSTMALGLRLQRMTPEGYVELMKVMAFRDPTFGSWARVPNLYKDYYSSLALHQLAVHPTGAQLWAKYQIRLRQQVLAKQNADGSWSDRYCYYGAKAGPLYTTSMGVLISSIQFRYLPIHRIPQ